jgi:hypothetical protein
MAYVIVVILSEAKNPINGTNFEILRFAQKSGRQANLAKFGQ